MHSETPLQLDLNAEMHEFRTEFLDPLYQLYPVLKEASQEREYFQRLKDHRMHYRKAAEFIKANHAGKTMPNVPRCVELVKSMTNRGASAAAGDNPNFIPEGETPWSAKQKHADKLKRDHFKVWYETATMRAQADAEGWGEKLKTFVREIIHVQAEKIAGLMNVGYHAPSLFICATSKDRSQWLYTITAEAKATGKICIAIPTWALDECRKNTPAATTEQPIF